jgi:hypothetical protein
VKITYEPIQEIVIHEVNELTPAQFFESIITTMQGQGQTGVIPTVLWLDGIAFWIGNYNVDNDQLISDQLKGIIHYAWVNFTKTSYQSEKHPTVAGKEYTVRLAKVENNPNFIELVNFLKMMKPVSTAPQVSPSSTFSSAPNFG